MIAQAIGDVCAQAPEGTEQYANLLISWVKYGVAAIIVAGGFLSVGAMVVGRIGSMSRAAQFGASGLVWCILGAIGYVTIYGVITAIVGKGC